MDGARSNFHLHGVLFRVLFHLLEIATVFCELCNDVTVRPVNLQCVRVLVVNVILSAPGTINNEFRREKEPHINGHLVHMYALSMLNSGIKTSKAASETAMTFA